MLSPYYQEKARMSFPSTPNFCNKARKRNLEREIKLFLLANNMIFIVDNSKEPNKKLVEIISEARKATGTKVNK